MDRHFDRSSPRERFPPLAPGRTSLVASKPKLAYEKIERITPRSPPYINGRCPPPPERFKRQRPSSGQSPTFLMEDIKRQRPGSGLKTPEDLTISGHTCTIIALDIELTADSSTPVTVMDKPQRNIKRDSAVKSFSVQHIGQEFSPTPNFISLSTESATNRPPTPVVLDAKAEKKRKRRERKEREARKFEEARLKEQEKLEKDRQVAELSRNRSIFNGNRDTLPSIGKKTAEVNFYMGKLPQIEEVDYNGKALPDNNVVDVIQKHEAQVETTAYLRMISQDYINASAELMEAYKENEALEIIEAHEEEVGRKHAATNYYVSGSYSNRSQSCRTSSARSRCPSGVASRRIIA
ncbi:uncharacterized protein LOC132718260 isoform X2 [Ruditapes philippinarum]|uniref:uncharacterized protein LOC132718260 isoform X2 n=1 Tax=Ruditapes philippinarum TaxID=129788 RepID=UPI00295AF8A7|nr:uncharacterized protein LOC132718260 isoform X2 [Ruditapes philippinarum]